VNGLHVGGAANCALRGRLPVGERRREEAGLGVVVSEQLGLGVRQLRELLRQGLRDVGVDLLAGLRNSDA
jgi:hypothetical protein